MLKKVTALFLSLIILTGTVSAAVYAAQEDETAKFCVATDIHLIEEGTPPEVFFPESELYFHARNSGNLYYETAGILVSFLEKAKEERPDFILMPGDLANSGSLEDHEYFRSFIESFEDETGIPVYVCPGNHDYYRSGVEDFRTIYHRFGFDEALVKDDITASYTADLPGNVRLISIDSNKPGDDGDGLDERLFGWIQEQAQTATSEGKTIIAMMHHPLLDPIPYAETFMKDFIVRNHEEVAEKFTSWGIQYIFTGHEHGNNITSFTGSNGRVIYDILTTALTSYPLEYRWVELSSENMEITQKQITECNFDYVYDGYNDAQLQLMADDYTAYSLGYFKYSIQKKIEKYISPEFIKNALNAEDGALAETVDIVMNRVNEALNMPLYTENEEGVCVKSLAKTAGVTFPESDYESLFDTVTSVVAKIYYGNENMPISSSPEGKIVVIGLNTMLKYVLAQTGNDISAQMLNKIVSALGFGELDKLDLYRWNRALVIGADNSYEIAFAALSPLLDGFLNDDAVPDRDSVLMGPGAESETVTGVEMFFEKLRSFFAYIFGILRAAVILPF